MPLTARLRSRDASALARVASLVAGSALACSSASSTPPPVDGGGIDVRRPPDPCGAEGGAPGDAGGMDGATAGAASLTSLSVTFSGGPRSALIPDFASGTTDYYVPCGGGDSELIVAYAASPGATASIALESPGGATSAAAPAMASASVTLKVGEGQAIVTSATAGSASVAYWVRCLPHDFSPIGWTTSGDACARTPGYYLVGDQLANAAGGAYAMVLDRNGVPVWYEHAPAAAPFESITGMFNVDSLTPGHVSFIPWPSALSAGPYEDHQLSPQAATQVSVAGWALDPHELRVLPNGDYLFFTDQVQTGVDLTGYDVPESDGGVQAFGKNASILPCTILEASPTGELVWSWVGTDHLDAVLDNTHPGLETDPSGVSIPDPFHCNSIDVDPTTGNLLVSARHEASVFYVERPSGTILWKMGGKSYTKDGATFIPVSDPFLLQHDARLPPGWANACGGQVTMFDDESYSTNPSRAIAYDVVTASGKAGCGPVGATVAWQYAGTLPSTAMGSFRILTDGSRVVGWGTAGQPGLTFSEVDDEGNVLLELHLTNNSYSYRAVKVPLSQLDLSVLRATAGLP